MNTKKLITAFAAALMLTGAAASAAQTERVIIPDYECVINDASVYYADSVYPLISFRNVTYFPMTYDYCRALGLTSQWIEGKGLYIAYLPSVQNELPIYETRKNSKADSAVIPEYPIYINGKRINNADAEYPLLNFRNVTYFPMTYDYATKEFDWETQWIPGKFTLNSNAGTNYTSTEIIKKDADGALLWLSAPVECTNANGESEISYVDGYKRLDYKTGALSAAAEEPDGENSRETTLTVDSKTGKVFWNGSEIELESGDGSVIQSGELNAYTVTLNGIDILYVTRYASNAPTGQTHCFLIDNGRAVKISSDFSAKNAAKLGGSIYVSGRRYVQTVFKHFFSKSTLFRYDENGDMTDITDSFDGYHSVKLLGEANGLLYLKCEWCPEQVLNDTNYHEIAAANDGYFTYDGNAAFSITKIANYRYADDELLAPNGDIYTVINWNGLIQKIAD